MQLIVADVNANDVCGTALQQAISETTGRLTDVQATKIFDVERNMLERTFKLESAARDEAIKLAGFDFQLNIGVNGSTRFRQRYFCCTVTSEHMPRRDQALRGCARRRKATLNKQQISAHGKKLDFY